MEVKDLILAVKKVIQETNTSCTICMSDFTREDPAFTTECGHKLHHSCFTRWACQTPSCPICRKETKPWDIKLDNEYTENVILIKGLVLYIQNKKNEWEDDVVPEKKPVVEVVNDRKRKRDGVDDEEDSRGNRRTVDVIQDGLTSLRNYGSFPLPPYTPNYNPTYAGTSPHYSASSPPFSPNDV
jgi:hypothetical protein